MPRRRRKPKSLAIAKPTGRSGRPPYEPTKDDRLEVKSLLQGNWTQGAICQYLDIDEETFLKHFRLEWRTAKLKLAAVCVSKIAIAINNSEEWAIKHFLHGPGGREAGWGVNRNELTGANGGAIQTANFNFDPERLRKLKPNELTVLERALGIVLTGDVGDQTSEVVADGGTEFARSLNVPKGKLAT